MFIVSPKNYNRKFVRFFIERSSWFFGKKCYIFSNRFSNVKALYEKQVFRHRCEKVIKIQK